MKLLMYLFVFILGFSAVFAVRYFQVKNFPRFQPEESEFSLNPPLSSLKGVLTVTDGTAKMLTRSSDDYDEASSGADVLQGESVAVDNVSAATVAIPGAVDVKLENQGDVTFANLFRENMVLVQKGGQVTYTVAGTDKPVSVRIRHSLLSFTHGDISVTVDDPSVRVQVIRGSAKLAIVDTDNNTDIYDIDEGKAALIDDENRTVRILPLSGAE